MSESADPVLGAILSSPAPELLTELSLLVIAEMVLSTVLLVGALVFAFVVLAVALASLALKWCVHRSWRRRR